MRVEQEADLLGRRAGQGGGLALELADLFLRLGDGRGETGALGLDGVALLTDMFGGTPSNLAISILDRANVEVIAGVNLPLLIKLAQVRADEPLPAAVAAAQEAGRKYINVASKLLADAKA